MMRGYTACAVRAAMVQPIVFKVRLSTIASRAWHMMGRDVLYVVKRQRGS
jgi:hypothetical protein